MATQPTYLEAFKAYTRVQYGSDEQEAEALKDLTDESDRGSIILSATGLEDLLEQTIGMRMPNLATDVAARKEMFGANGVVSTFSQKIFMAYALGIIDKPLRKKIDLVREIRNGCAHGRLPLSFERKELQDVCKVIIGQDFLAKLTNQDPATLRMAFIVAVATLGQSVAYGRRIDPEEGFRIATEQERRKTRVRMTDKP